MSPQKPEMAFLPWPEIEQVALVENHGAEKYSRYGWREKTSDDHINAALRHISARLQGRLLDDRGARPSGLPHLAHAVARLLFAMAVDRQDGERCEICGGMDCGWYISPFTGLRVSLCYPGIRNPENIFRPDTTAHEEIFSAFFRHFKSRTQGIKPKR